LIARLSAWLTKLFAGFPSLSATVFCVFFLRAPRNALPLLLLLLLLLLLQGTQLRMFLFMSHQTG